MLIWMNVPNSPPQGGLTETTTVVPHTALPSLRYRTLGLTPGRPIFLKSIRFILVSFYHNSHAVVNRLAEWGSKGEAKRV